MRHVCAVDTRTVRVARQASLDKIAEERHRAARALGIAAGFFNPHRSPLGLGNYDVVVLESAVQAQNCQWQVAARTLACARARFSRPPARIRARDLFAAPRQQARQQAVRHEPHNTPAGRLLAAT